VVAADGRRQGQPIQLSIRPEAISIGTPNGANGANGADHIQGEVEQVAYLGAAVQYHVRTSGGLGLSVLAGKTASRFASGDSVVLAWAPSDALVLGDRSGTVEDAT
jgi:ABC-type Fe3+/spermidine/putrescine transport system ATPase subunit